MKEYGDKIPADKKEPIESALTNLKAAHATQEVSQIDPAVEKLNEAWAAASQELYAAMNEQGGANPDASNASNEGPKDGGDHVEDVDFEEVK